MRNLLISAILVILAACGGQPPQPTIPSIFVGTWKAMLVANVTCTDGEPPATFEGDAIFTITQTADLFKFSWQDVCDPIYGTVDGGTLYFNRTACTPLTYPDPPFDPPLTFDDTVTGGSITQWEGWLSLSMNINDNVIDTDGGQLLGTCQEQGTASPLAKQE